MQGIATSTGCGGMRTCGRAQASDLRGGTIDGRATSPGERGVMLNA